MTNNQNIVLDIKKELLTFYKNYDTEYFYSLNLPNWKYLNSNDKFYENFFFYNEGLLFKQDTLYLENSNNFIENSNIFLKNNQPLINTFPLNNEEFFKEYLIFENYLTLRKLSFISFFINNMIDVPICFRKSKSLKNKNFELFFIKFSNLMMRQGKKEKIVRFFLSSFFVYFDKIKNEKFNNRVDQYHWFDFFFMLNFQITTKSSFFLTQDEEPTFNNLEENIFSKNYKFFNSDDFIKNLIKSLILKQSPIFSYYIYNVDKNIRKYTRGKSGKYVFVWKYVSAYKRKYLMFRWFLQEIKFDESRDFKTRIINLLNNLTNNFKNTYAWKAKNYTYAFIFKNFRKSLMMNLKTIAK